MARGRRGAKSGITRKPPASGDVPDVYMEMLADAVSSSPTQTTEDGRPIKRRRVGGRIVTQGNEGTSSYRSDASMMVADTSELDDLFEDVEPNRQQIVQTESEDSADSDMDWEEVGIGDQVNQEVISESEDADTGQLSLVLGVEDDDQNDCSRAKVKRKPMTVEDKKLRLVIHKMHLCSLLAHLHLRNHWCNDNDVSTILRKLLTKKNISYLNPDESISQFQRSRSFMDGLEQASDAFRAEFKITARGMGKSKWADSPETLALLQPPDDIDLPMQISDFRNAAQELEASRDVGTQLFCAMLRSAGVDARLVCSLQPLPFQPSQKVELHEVKSRASLFAEKRVRASGHAENAMAESSNADTIVINAEQGRPGPNTESKSPQAVQNLSPPVPLPPRKRRKVIRESKYPIYWVEAFNEAVQKWVPVDPLVTKTIAKPSKFEPPAGEPQNHMSYVVAFEDDGYARDVTKRYVKAYNAKTRRERVEGTNDGERWWRMVMKMYRRPHSLDRDQVEDAELTSKEAAEPMPRNVQDFKNHPYYALERHLKRHEAIHPRREVGKVGAGRAGSINSLEPIFRRRDVHMVKSADKWYRLGREIKPGEQPLKRIPVRRKRGLSSDLEDRDAADEDNVGSALYAVHQTTVYSAPPVVNGRIPKNVYGNLDVYVDSMVPSGGAHIPHPETARAAKIIGVDYADAVTGFVFKGRHGTAVTKGAVVAVEYKEAVEEVIKAFEDDRARAEEERRSLDALRMWKRMLAGLRIMERIEGYDIEGERDERAIAMKEEMNKVDEEENQEEGGGFFPDRDAEVGVQPTAGKIPAEGWADVVDDEGGGFMAEAEDESSLMQPEIDPPRSRDHFINNLEEDAGGFLVNDTDADAEEALQEITVRDNNQSLDRNPEREDDQGGGGFVPDEEETASVPTGKEINEQAIESTFATSEGLTPGSAIPNLPNEELEEALMLQQLYETGGVTRFPVVTQAAATLIPGDRPTGRTSGDLSYNSTVEPAPLVSHPPTISASPVENGQVGEASLEFDSSSDEKGSLLSHDPDDEDADPEWLT